MRKTGKLDHNNQEICVGDMVFVNYKCKFNSDSFHGVVKIDDEDEFYIQDVISDRRLDLEIPSNWLFIVNCKR